MGLLEAFRAVKRVTTGDVVKQIDATANNAQTKMSLRLKVNKGSGDHYVIPAGLSEDNHQYYAFTKDEFDQFYKAVQTIHDSLTRVPRG
jgi:hypothetical protein